MRASDRTTDSAGEMQGVQPRPNTIPSSGAVATPSRGAVGNRNVPRPQSSQPANISPSRMDSSPTTMVIGRCQACSAPPTDPNRTPLETNTSANPATNPRVPASIRPRRAPSLISEAPSPVANDR